MSATYKDDIVWKNIFLFIILHSSLPYSLWAILFLHPWATLAFVIIVIINTIVNQSRLDTRIATFLGFCSGLGVTAGAHRLWSHRSYKAKLPLRIFLCLMQTVAGQNHLYEWCRDHRVHHKFSETDADPHNAKRGFFFSHMGWLCVRKHKDVLEKGKTVSCEDLLQDPVIVFQKKYFWIMSFIVCFLIPTLIPIYCWNETCLTSFMIAFLARYCCSLHVTWLVNSAAHMFGYRPYDEQIGARENIFVALGAMGEGFHNYHHTFPWDYSTGELGWKWNFSTFFINTMASIGQAYDLKRAPKSLVETSQAITEDIAELKKSKELKNSSGDYQLQIVWRNVALFAYLHIAALYGLYLCFGSAKLLTIIFAGFLYVISGLGITAGAHRLWAHRSYKAKWPLRLMLAFFNSIAFENDIYEWARDHRVHHKFSETDADPHNALRGFFFAHIGWLLCKKHPDVLNKGKTVDCSDIIADPIVRFQRRYYIPLMVSCCFLMPTFVPHLCWGETKWNAFFICALLRYCFTLNMTWLVNSAAHMWGRQPYDKHINPRENVGVALGAIGEGYHNYHHTFPWDYSTSELGWKINLTTIFIDTFAKIGWAYDLKKVSPEMIRQ
ncbi:stearoyl-CoA desaturase 5-like protein, partial [Leptotrombidium deliense]